MQPVLVMGACGRMGATLVHLVQKSAAFTLAGVVEQAENAAELTPLGCPVAAQVSTLLEKTPQAVVIDFTAPAVSLQTARAVAACGGSAVIGTTGFSASEMAELETLAKQARLFWAPNMSIGVNALVRVLPVLERILGDEYDLELTEIHHHHKKDAPSGTALRLAEVLAASRGWNLDQVAEHGRQGLVGARKPEEFGIHALRGGDVVGDHTVYFFGAGERIEVTHRAHSRENFARGALRAARWLSTQVPERLYSMTDLLGGDVHA